MKGAFLGKLVLTFTLLGTLLLSGCATPKGLPTTSTAPSSMIVLLPEGDKVSGEVTVANANGSQVLNQSWQAVEITGNQGRPTDPVVMGNRAVQDAFAPVRTAMPERPVHYLLYFKLDSAEMLSESKLLLPKIVAEIKQRRPAQLSVVGHADALGSVHYNYRLGQARAAAVVEQLALQGAAPASVETYSRGKSELLVKTSDQTPEPRNRRAEVTIR